jgi:hypothetical protein
MWIMLNDSFLSIVAVPGRPRVRLVRARRDGDIEKVFPGARAHPTPGRDYAFRAIVLTKRVKAALAAEVDRIDYTNFKDSVTEDDRHDAYLEVWGVMLPWGKGLIRRPARWADEREPTLWPDARTAASGPGPLCTEDEADAIIADYRKGKS